MSDRSYRPRARDEGLVIEPLGEELLVFDSQRERAHSLNETAAKVWRACDGERDIYALQVACTLDEDTLQLALERLRTSRLLDEPEGPDRVSRRAMLRRSALAGAGIGVAMPVIRSITAPTPAMAVSGCTPTGSPAPQGQGRFCCTGHCAGTPCVCCAGNGDPCASTNDCCGSGLTCTSNVCM